MAVSFLGFAGSEERRCAGVVRELSLSEEEGGGGAIDMRALLVVFVFCLG